MQQNIPNSTIDTIRLYGLIAELMKAITTATPANIAAISQAVADGLTLTADKQVELNKANETIAQAQQVLDGVAVAIAALDAKRGEVATAAADVAAREALYQQAMTALSATQNKLGQDQAALVSKQLDLDAAQKTLASDQAALLAARQDLAQREAVVAEKEARIAKATALMA